ncbi:hypothetical protein MMC31_002491 [Peltigera leucophlebia]|nr:hypothetical protein [Peltigera leucophlebia]
MFGINVFKVLTRASEESPATFAIENNPYKAQKEWPPDFTKLNPKYQLRFERRYRRRTKLKGTKPSWNRNLGLFAAGSELAAQPKGFNVDTKRSANPGGYRGQYIARDSGT